MLAGSTDASSSPALLLRYIAITDYLEVSLGPAPRTTWNDGLTQGGEKVPSLNGQGVPLLRLYMYIYHILRWYLFVVSIDRYPDALWPNLLVVAISLVPLFILVYAVDSPECHH